MEGEKKGGKKKDAINVTDEGEGKKRGNKGTKERRNVGVRRERRKENKKG